MRSALLVLILLAQPIPGATQLALRGEQQPPRVAWNTPNADYPLQVHMLSSARQYSRHNGIDSTKSYGSGNLIGNPTVGFDYNSDCPGGFLHNGEESESYQGKWKKQNQQLEILLVQTGSKYMEKCKVNVTLKSAPYTRDNPPPRLVTAH